MKVPSSPPIIKVAMPVPLHGLFDYLAPDNGPEAVTGSRVVARFGRRELVGIVVKTADDTDVPDAKLQKIIQVLDDGEPVMSAGMLKLLTWCSAYYKHPLGEVLMIGLPPDLRRVKGVIPPPPVQYGLTDSGRVRLGEAPGRAQAQMRVLELLSNAPLNRPEMLARDKSATRVLKTLLEKNWVEEQNPGPATLQPSPGPTLTAEQAVALEGITAPGEGFSTHLLDGVTGSGKTEIYLRLAEPVLAAGRQVLVLVPEIGLTPQLVDRFRERLGMEPVLSHSSIASGERLRAWASAWRGDARLMIGTRSALFLPMSEPGLIIMDEAHDASFKQQDGFRYSARDVAVKRAQDLDIPIVLGTATPSLETLHNAATGKFHHHHLRERATGASPPVWQVTDLRQQSTTGGLAQPAMQAIADALERREQVLVFLNRRGYAPVLLCHSCGWNASCQRCDANMTWHRSTRRLVCHHCEYGERVPRFCPGCQADALEGAGEGTEQLESFLAKQFPDTPLMRVDRDQVRKRGELEAIIEQVKSGQPCILVGTQMLAKGHHFPRVTLVVVVNLDQAMYSADFRAMERMGQLLLQVAGRAGRESRAGTVVLQTHHPDHPALETLIGKGYSAFAGEQLQDRQLANLPPFAYQAVLRAEAVDRDSAQAFLAGAARLWKEKGSQVFGPFPAMMERRAGRFRWYLLVQGQIRMELQAALDAWLPGVRALPDARKVRWTVDLDPQEF